MTFLYPSIEPYKTGFLPVSSSDRIYWEICGNSEGIPTLVVHGGPGSGSSPWWRRLFDPTRFKIILFDQRGCGKSSPSASDFSTSLEENNTMNLVKDKEELRNYLSIDSWLILGGSWGCTLSFAYAIQYPTRIKGMVLFGITTGRHSGFNWTFRGGLSNFFPEQWNNLVKGIDDQKSQFDVVTAYSRMLNEPDPEIRKRATVNWCVWESVSTDWPLSNKLHDRFKDPRYAYGFARLVTHYVSNNGFLQDEIILNEIHRLKNVPCYLVNGRFDFQAPIKNAWILKQYLPEAHLIIVDDSGHRPNDNLEKEILSSINKFS